ncbi:MAG: hypothetical protein QW331_03640 [Candidatus Woesearchaeota archaeon]
MPHIVIGMGDLERESRIHYEKWSCITYLAYDENTRVALRQ